MSDTPISIKNIIPGDVRQAGWATEDTLVKLQQSGEKSRDYLNIIGTKLASKDKELFQKLKEIAGETQKSGDEEEKIRGAVNAGNEKISGALDYQRKYLGETFKGAILGLSNITDSKGMFGQLSGSANSVAHALKDINPAAAATVKSLGLFIAGIDFAWHRVTALSDSFTSLYSTGLVFDTGMRGIIDAANGAGMSVENFSKMITKFGAAAASLGVTNIARLNKQFLQNTKSGSELQMTQDQASEAFLSTVETMRSTGKLSSMSGDDIVKSSKSYIKNINDLSEATGRNRDEIAKSTQEIMKQSDVNVLARLLPTDQRDQFRNQIAGYAATFGEGGKELASLSAQIRLAGGSMGTLTGDMATIVNQVPGLYEALNATDTEAPKRAAMAFANMDPQSVANLMNSFPAAGKWINQMVQQGQQAIEIDELRAKRGKEGLTADEKNKLENAEYLETQAKVQQALSHFQNSITRLAVSFGQVLMPVVQSLSLAFEVVARVVGYLGDGIDYVSTKISGYMQVLGMGKGSADLTGGVTVALTAGLVVLLVKKVAGALMGGASGIFTKLLSWGPLGKITKMLPSFGGGGASKAAESVGSAGAGITGGLKNMVGNVSTMIGDAFKTLTGILKNGADAIGSAIASLGKGIGSALGDLGVGLGKAVEGIVGGLGKGVGAALGAILQGLAIGLKAFASPQVLIGAGILSLSILAIGAAVAGATWMLGKALPTFAEGLKSFGDIDGSNLVKVGLGTLALGAGLAAMGIGEVVNKVGGLVSGLLGFFQEDPATKIKRFVGYFQLLADGKDAVEAGSAVAERLGQINIGSSLGPTINALSEAFSSKYFSKDLGDVKEDYINKFFNIIGIIGKAGTDIDPGLGVLNQISKINIGSNLGETIKNLADSFSKKYLSADVSDINTEMINKLFDVFAVFGQGLDSVQLGLDTMKLLANTKDIVKNMSGGISSLANIGSILPRNLNTASIIMQIDSIMMIFERFAQNNTIIEQAVNSINTLGTVNVAGLTTLQNLFTGSNQNLGGNAAIGGPPGTAITGLDKATSDYYEKTVMQFNRMIELLEVAHADAIDIKRIETDGLKDITDAVKASSGRIF